MIRSTLALVVLAAGAASSAQADELIVTGMSGIVQTIDLETGVVGHRGVCTGSVRAQAVADGTLYLAGFFGDIYVFDMNTNQVVDTLSVEGDINAMAWLGDRLLVATEDSRLLYLDPADGKVLDTVQITQTDITTIGVDSGGLFVGGQSSLALRSHLGQNDFDFFAACGSRINAMAFSADTMFLAGTHFGNEESGTVYKFDKFVGGVNYSGTFNAPNNAQAVLAHGGLLYVGGSDGLVHEMNPQTGAVLRTFDLFIPVTGISPTNGLVSCPADYDISGGLNFFDVGLFLQIFTEQSPAADTNGDGVHNFFDVEGFLNLFNSGCP